MLVPLAACHAPAASNAALEQSSAKLDQVPLTITTARGQTHRFAVEVARTPEEHANGLMNRRSMPADHGMLFPYQPAQTVAFWMKDTLIPLDMIFISPGGRILRIQENVAPMSLEPVGSGDVVEAVLEINGGRSSEFDIRPGDRVTWRH